MEDLGWTLDHSFVFSQTLAFPLMVKRLEREWHVIDRAARKYRLQFGKPIQDARQHHSVDQCRAAGRLADIVEGAGASRVVCRTDLEHDAGSTSCVEAYGNIQFLDDGPQRIPVRFIQ